MLPLPGDVLAPGGGGGGGAGDIVGPASSTDNAIVRYDGTTGKLLQNSDVTIAEPSAGAVVIGTTGSAYKINIGYPGLGIDGANGSFYPASGQFRFDGNIGFNGTIWLGSSNDVAIERSAANVLKVTDGSTGYGNLLVDNINFNDGGTWTAANPYFNVDGSTPGNLQLKTNGGVYGSRLDIFSGGNTQSIRVDGNANMIGMVPTAKIYWSDTAGNPDYNSLGSLALKRLGDGQLAITGATKLNEPSTNIKMAMTTVNLTGASTTATGLFPAKSYHLGVTARITTGVTSGDGGTSIDVGDGTDVDRYAAALGFTVNGTVDMSLATADPTGWLSGAGDVVFTCNAGTFSGGVVRVVAHYIDLSPPTS